MSIEHLKLLRESLERNKWVVQSELPGNDYDISAIWSVSRPSGDLPFNLVFEGLDDLSALPVEKAYACHLQDNKEVSLYFGKVSKSFTVELASFVESLSHFYI